MRWERAPPESDLTPPIFPLFTRLWALLHWAERVAFQRYAPCLRPRARPFHFSGPESV